MNGKPVPFVLFRAEAQGIDMYVTEKGLTYVLIKIKEGHEDFKKYDDRWNQEGQKKIEWARIDMNLKGASFNRANIIKEGMSTDFRNYFLGHCPEGIANVHGYEKIFIKDVSPGIDWILPKSRKQNLEVTQILGLMRFFFHPLGEGKLG